MESKSLGNTTHKISAIGFGTWNYRRGPNALESAIERGACFFDTAELYGTEGIVGEAIRNRRHQVFVATKAAPRHFRRKDLIAAAHRSLHRLRTEYIDLYQLHWPNYAIPIEETMSAMEELVDAGKVRFIGVSNFGVHDLRRAQASLVKHRIVANQVRYSLIDRTIERGLLNYCRENAITVIAFSPLGSNFHQFTMADPEGELARIAATTGRTPAQVALNWLVAKEGVVALPRASTEAHVREDCEASGWRLSDRDYASLEKSFRYQCKGPLELAARRMVKNVLQHVGRQI
jgi:diketogulonate reductase-like aldo/keto reductase